MDVDIIVTTFGDSLWEKMGAEAADRASHQSIAHHHHIAECQSLGDARNQAVEAVDPQEWICFLDADDELESGYIEAMERAYDVYQPEDTLYVPSLRLGRSKPQSLGHLSILNINPCPIGTLIHRSAFDRVGRFWDEPAWEDWSLFRRAYLTGTTLTFVPDAVYHARSTPRGRNSTIKDPQGLMKQIKDSHEAWLIETST